MNRLSDMDLNVAVRRVLVRHWIDLGRVSVRTTRAVVCLSGALVRMKNGGDELSNEGMLGIFQEIKNLHGVRRMHLKLINWGGGTEVGSTEESVAQSGPVNVYEAKVNPSLTLEDVLNALGRPKDKKPEESREPITP